MKYWELLLNNWHAKGRSGLTIPFIIGSQRFLPATHRHQNIEELLIEIIDNANFPVYVKYCIDINSIILEKSYPNKQWFGHFPKFNGKGQKGLFVTTFLNDLGTDCEAIILELKNKFQHYIDEGKFSVVSRAWSNYTHEEINFIKKSFEAT